MWDIETRRIIKILKKPNDSCQNLFCHPLKPLLFIKGANFLNIFNYESFENVQKISVNKNEYQLFSNLNFGVSLLDNIICFRNLIKNKAKKIFSCQSKLKTNFYPDSMFNKNFLFNIFSESNLVK
jgi:hypothetical protein